MMMADGMHSEDGEIFTEGKWGSSRQESSSVDEDGIEVNGDDGETISINENGIQIKDKDGENKVVLGKAPKTDAVEQAKKAEQKLKEEKRRIEDSLRKSMEETQRKLDKLKDNASLYPGPHQFVIAGYNPAMMLSLDL